MSVLERLLGREHEKGFSITPLRKRDLRHGILDIEAAAYPVGWSHNVFVSEIDQMRSGTRHYVVARQDGNIVGYAGLWFAVDEAHVTNVAVDPDTRRQGVARALMLHLAEVAVERGCVAWTLEVRLSSSGRPAAVRGIWLRVRWRAPALLRQRRRRDRDVVPRHPGR